MAFDSRLSVPSLIATCLIGCTHIAPVQDPVAYLNERSPRQVWITEASTDSAQLMKQPRFEGDTLVGLVAGQYQRVPRAELREMRAVEPAPRRTAALIALPLAALGLYEVVSSALREPYVPPYTVPVGYW
jgi:hypothetical protein